MSTGFDIDFKFSGKSPIMPKEKLINIWQNKEGNIPLTEIKGRQSFYMDFYNTPFGECEIIVSSENPDEIRIWLCDIVTKIDVKSDTLVRYEGQIISHKKEIFINMIYLKSSTLWESDGGLVPDQLRYNG